MTPATSFITSGSSLNKYPHRSRAMNNTRLIIKWKNYGDYPFTTPILVLAIIPTLDAVLAASSSVAPNKFPTLVETATDTANLHQPHFTRVIRNLISRYNTCI